VEGAPGRDLKVGMGGRKRLVEASLAWDGLVDIHCLEDRSRLDKADMQPYEHVYEGTLDQVCRSLCYSPGTQLCVLLDGRTGIHLLPSSSHI